MLRVLSLSLLGMLWWQGSSHSLQSGAKKDSQAKPLRRIAINIKPTVVAVSPDGKWIAVANGSPSFYLLGGGKSEVADDWQATALILNAATGKTVVRLKLSTTEEDALLDETERVPPFQVEALAFSPDGRMLAIGTTVGQIKLYEVKTGNLRLTLDDEKAKLADKNTPEKLRTFKRALGSDSSLAFSPDGRQLAACGDSFSDSRLVREKYERSTLSSTGPGRLKVWDIATGKLQHDLVGHDRHANAVAFSPDGKLLASAGSWAGSEHGSGVILWNPQTGAKIRRITTTANGGTNGVVFSPDSQHVAIGYRYYESSSPDGKSVLRLCRVDTGKIEWEHTIPGWTRIKSITPDGKSVALRGPNTIHFVDLQTGKSLRNIGVKLSPEPNRWGDIAIAAGAGTIVMAGVDAKGGFLEVWDVEGFRGK
ncbi:MAG TPA: hypothetical protein VE988_19580 [Gemmataceae bacterium]|nr:hypothetical protein [Gemmataceae bacterium]